MPWKANGPMAVMRLSSRRRMVTNARWEKILEVMFVMALL